MSSIAALVATPFLTSDEVYQQIIGMHVGLSAEESQSANAKLMLKPANHIGDANVIREAVNVARDNTLRWREGAS